jgi:hypothetical protein
MKKEPGESSSSVVSLDLSLSRPDDLIYIDAPMVSGCPSYYAWTMHWRVSH